MTYNNGIMRLHNKNRKNNWNNCIFGRQLLYLIVEIVRFDKSVYMRASILCPRCIEAGRKPEVLAKYEDVFGRGDLWLWCRACKKDVHIYISNISLD